MSHQSYRPRLPRAYLVDLEEPLMGIMSVLADYCEDYRMFSHQELLLNAMNFLTVEHTEKEAIEALGIEISTYCHYPPTPFNRDRINAAIEKYIYTIHNEFMEWNLYGDDYMLKVTFVGWHGDFTAIFVPHEQAKHFKGAIPTVVQSEPIYGRPFKSKVPFPPYAEPVLPF